jgi:ADP-ribosylation factor GTPase-activating protein 2/3
MKEENESEFADKELIPILEIESNKVCNDCGKREIHWCSINNSVLLCSSCARTHKKFNPKISTIKSLEVDSWTKEEIEILKLGGNEKFTKMIKSYNIPLTKDNQEYKYYTKAAQYYRDILLAQSKNNPINNIPKPSLKEGIEILYKDEYSNLFNKYTNQQNNDISQQEKNEIINNDNNISNNNGVPDTSNSSWLDRMAEKLAPDIEMPNNSNNNINSNNNSNNNNNNAYSFDNLANNMLYAFNEVKERAKDIDFKEKIKMAGE